MIKQEARKRSMVLRQQMPDEEVKESSLRIAKKLMGLPCFLNSETVYCYVSYNKEVNTRPIIEKALAEGKKVAVPKVLGKEMEFYRIHSFSELVPGYRGILEPSDMEKLISSNVFMVLPGLSFDLERNRVGYGGGFYDRYLAAHRKITFKKTALAFDFQVVESIEAEECDEPVDMVVTEKRLI